MALVSCACGHLERVRNAVPGSRIHRGYRDAARVESCFVISFEGNAYTVAARVHPFWMRRCAKVAKARGYASQIFVREVTQDTSIWPLTEPDCAEDEQQVADG